MRRGKGWEPTVFRWAARTLVATTATFTAVALVWGEDLQMDGVAAAASLVVALAAAVTAFAFAAAYRRTAAQMRAEAMRHHPAGQTRLYDYEKDAR